MSNPHLLRFNNTYQTLSASFYSHVAISPLQQPHLVSFNAHAGQLIDLDARAFIEHHYIDIFNGVTQLSNTQPIATVYAGHQFGVFVSQLGDGRAILLGEAINQRDEKWDVQIKGAGLTPYSRMGDGRAVLRSTIREYLCSEAMHALGIPTTRGLCVIGSQEPVYRETKETGALLVRLAKTHIRIGHFEFFYYRNQHEELKQLIDYVIEHHYPHLLHLPDTIAQFFNAFVERTAQLMAHWQAVGFTHGVMNSDNFSIIGDTLDYGPFGFMEAFDVDFIPNHSDHQGRYSYEQQPHIGLWNCACLAQTLTPFIEKEQLSAALENFSTHFTQTYSQLLLNKLGFTHFIAEDQRLLDDLFKLLAGEKTDYTIFYRMLSHFEMDSENNFLTDLFVDREQWKAWANRYHARLKQQGIPNKERQLKQLSSNPKYILRKHLAQIAITKAQNHDFSEVERLLKILQSPFEEQPENHSYAAPPPEWAAEIELSCSS